MERTSPKTLIPWVTFAAFPCFAVLFTVALDPDRPSPPTSPPRPVPTANQNCTDHKPSRKQKTAINLKPGRITAVGVFRCQTELFMPNCPSLFEPQQESPPPLIAAHVCRYPAAIAVTDEPVKLYIYILFHIFICEEEKDGGGRERERGERGGERNRLHVQSWKICPPYSKMLWNQGLEWLCCNTSRSWYKFSSKLARIIFMRSQTNACTLYLLPGSQSQDCSAQQYCWCPADRRDCYPSTRGRRHLPERKCDCCQEPKQVLEHLKDGDPIHLLFGPQLNKLHCRINFLLLFIGYDGIAFLSILSALTLPLQSINLVHSGERTNVVYNCWVNQNVCKMLDKSELLCYMSISHFEVFSEPASKTYLGRQNVIQQDSRCKTWRLIDGS